MVVVTKMLENKDTGTVTTIMIMTVLTLQSDNDNGDPDDPTTLHSCLHTPSSSPLSWTLRLPTRLVHDSRGSLTSGSIT